jgi:protein involved in polysaccharide export with SLBB domain
VGLVGAALLCSAATCSERPLPSSLRGTPTCPMTLGPEDVVTIRVFGEEQLTGDYQADTQGNLDFPFVGRLNIRGKTNTSLAAHIKTALVEGEYLVSPQVSVVIKEHNSARVSVDGRVARPGTFPFRTGLTLVEAVSLAGGMTPMADRSRVRLTRATGEDTATVMVPASAIYDGREPDVRLCPGDQVYVPESVL